jgi:hypothetical protein
MAMSPRDRRLLIIMGAVVGVALIFFVVTHKKGADTVALTPGVAAPAPAGVAATPATALSPSPQKSAKLVFSGRDPFVPLVVETTAPDAGASPVAGVSPAGTVGSGNGGSSQSVGGSTVTLDNIFTVGSTQKAQVDVDGTVYTVEAGDSFAGNYQLVSISGTCANFTFGDQAFSLCETAQK